MKSNLTSYLPISETEQAAQGLWGQFDRQDEETFWPQYEALVVTQRVTKVSKASPIVPQKASSASVVAKVQAFKPTSEYYLYSRLVVIIYLAITALLVISVMTNTTPLFENKIILIALVVYVTVFLFIGKFALGYNIFKTDSKYLLVYRPLFFAHSYEEWDNIASIVIEKDLNSQRSLKQKLILTTFEQKTREYNYPLSPESHQLFFNFLKTKVPNTQYKVKG